MADDAIKKAAYAKTGADADLTKSFKAWCVPGEGEFARLINRADTPLRASKEAGLEGGGDDSDNQPVAPLSIHCAVGGGLSCEGGPLVLNVDGTTLSPPSLDGEKKLGLKVMNSDILKITANGLAVQIKEKGGLVRPTQDTNQVALAVSSMGGLLLRDNDLHLNADQQALKTDSQGVRIVCKPDGGLKVDESGLDLNMDYLMGLLNK